MDTPMLTADRIPGSGNTKNPEKSPVISRYIAAPAGETLARIYAAKAQTVKLFTALERWKIFAAEAVVQTNTAASRSAAGRKMTAPNNHV